MSVTEAIGKTPLEAASPFEMRVDLGKDVPETDVRSALKSGDIGFLHSFTTGSAVDGPGIRLVAWTTSCMFRCQYCHNPDTWTLSNGIPVPIEKAREELRKYAPGLKAMHGGFTLSGGEPLMQPLAHPFLVAVALGGIKMPIAELERGLHGIDAHLLLQGHGAEPDGWNARAVGFNGIHGSLTLADCR